MSTTTAQRAPKSASNFAPAVEANGYGMNDRIKRLRQLSFEAEPSLSIERALIETRFYKENYGKYPVPILRALNFLEICRQFSIWIFSVDHPNSGEITSQESRTTERHSRSALMPRICVLRI